MNAEGCKEGAVEQKNGQPVMIVLSRNDEHVTSCATSSFSIIPDVSTSTRTETTPVTSHKNTPATLHNCTSIVPYIEKDLLQGDLDDLPSEFYAAAMFNMEFLNLFQSSAAVMTSL